MATCFFAITNQGKRKQGLSISIYIHAYIKIQDMVIISSFSYINPSPSSIIKISDRGPSFIQIQGLEILAVHEKST